MNQTFQICNARDCQHGDFPKCPYGAVDPCNVFYNEETGMWHHELTSALVLKHELGDGRQFDVQTWLHVQLRDAFQTWKRGKKVHKVYERITPISAPSGYAAQAPKYSAEELDAIADNFIRSRQSVEQVSDEISDLGQEIHGYERMMKKWKGHPIIEQRIKTLKEERAVLRQVQSDMDKGSRAAKSHLKADHLYTKRWIKPKGRWNDFILFYQDKQNRIWTIDRNGLRVDANYVHLPEEDKKFMESAIYAYKHHGIPTNAWEKLFTQAEAIGDTLRRFGKKNVNGRRIRARADQRRYAVEVLDIIKFLKASKVDVREFGNDDALYDRYMDEVAPRLSRE